MTTVSPNVVSQRTSKEARTNHGLGLGSLSAPPGLDIEPKWAPKELVAFSWLGM